MNFVPLFLVSFSGLPRRLHDFPAIFMGWQSMATVGHFITMLGVLSFYTAILEAHLEKKITYYLFSLVPRINKRMSYYLLKIINLQLQAKILAFIPNKKTRLSITSGISFIKKC